MDLSAPQKTILRILSDSNFYSGNELAKKLGVSRTTIWKHLRELSALGLEISAVSGRGYRLNHPVQLLNNEAIRRDLNHQTSNLVSEIFVHDKIKSTNRYLREKMLINDSQGLVCLAESQSSGKGRSGHEWVSPFGRNIYLSLLWRFECGPAAISGLSLAIGVAVLRTLDGLKIPEVGLKWPNDILWQGKKLGGILVEVFGEAHGPCTAIVGLGLNVHMPDQQGSTITQPWIDLYQILEQNIPQRNTLVATLLNHMVPITAMIDKTGLAPYLSEWRKGDCLKDTEAVLRVGDQSICGTVQGINDNGLIVFRLDNGDCREFSSGEVSFRTNNSN